MSGLEVFASVAAIISAFHNAAELAAQLEHKKWRPRESTEDDDEANRRKLQVSFETAESLIGFRYASDLDKAGHVSFGDDNARDRLLHIASTIQRQIVQSLELAVNYDNAVLDLPSLHEASILNRKDTIEALDELKQRVLLEHHPQRIASNPRIYRNARGSIISVLPSQSPTSTSHDSLSTSSPVMGPASMERNDVCRISSTRRKERAASMNSKRSSRPALESINLNLALDYFLRGKNPEERKEAMKEIDELLATYQELTACGDGEAALAALNGQPHAVKRDSLEAHMVDATRRFAGFNEDTLEMANAIPTSTGGSGDNSIVNSKKDSAIDEWIESSQPSPGARWSSISSACSDHTITSDPPSLYRYSSTSSHESDFLPASPPSPHHSNTHAPQDSRHAIRGPEILHSTNEKVHSRSRIESLIVAPLAVKARPTILKNLPSVLKDKPPFPIIDHRGFKDSKKQEENRTHPDHHDEFDRRSDSTIHVPTQLRTPPHSITPDSNTPSHSRSRSHTPCIISPKAPPTGKTMGCSPSKENNYQGFCKGAWAVREDLKKGLSLETRPTGMYSTSQVWRCKHCCFEGPSVIMHHPTKKHKKEVIVDPKIYTSSVGIRYRWMFLAKSHVKLAHIASNKQLGGMLRKDNVDIDGCSFACLICSVEQKSSGVFVNVETLMNHIFMEHARTGLADSVLKASKCILGRTAGADEDWDINLPNEDTCVVML